MPAQVQNFNPKIENYLSMNNCSIIILAAGASRRLGHAKQLLDVQGMPMLTFMIKQAINSMAKPVIVVLGANAESIKSSINTNEVELVENSSWQEGMSSSIRTGINYLTKVHPHVQASILMMCDQPFVTTELINKIIETQNNAGKDIVTCSFAGVIGPPALFTTKIFPELLKLKGDAGAKKIIERSPDQVATVPFPKGEIDLDTESDYQQWLSGTSHP